MSNEQMYSNGANSGETVTAKPSTKATNLEWQNTQKRSKKRNRLSASERAFKCEAVAADYMSGHPFQAIMARNNLSKEQLVNILNKLFIDGLITVVKPSYEVVSLSTTIKNLPFLKLEDCKYVRIEEFDERILLTPYVKEDSNV